MVSDEILGFLEELSGSLLLVALSLLCGPTFPPGLDDAFLLGATLISGLFGASWRPVLVQERVALADSSQHFGVPPAWILLH